MWVSASQYSGALLLKADRMLSSCHMSGFACVALECGGEVMSCRQLAAVNPPHTDVVRGLTGRIKGEWANRAPLDMDFKHLSRVRTGASTKGSAQAHSFGIAQGEDCVEEKVAKVLRESVAERELKRSRYSRRKSQRLPRKS
jgi:hypothetical protein